MIDYLRYKLFCPIKSTAKYEAWLAEMDNNSNKIQDILSSDSYKRYEELKLYVGSGDCKRDIDTIKKEKFKHSKEYGVEQKLKRLKKHKDVKLFLGKGENADSVQVAEYLRLKEQVNSDLFNERKAYLCDSNKHKASEAYKKQQEYISLKNTQEIKALPKLQKLCEKYTAEKNQWECIFNEDFSSSVLDEKWIAKPSVGEKYLGISYSNEGDLQCTTDGKNISISNSVLRIITKQEDTEGLVWSQKFGFLPRKFNYTSGILSTTEKLELLHGKLTARVKIPKTKGMYHAFWLANNKGQLPFINLFCANNGKLYLGAFKKGQKIEKRVPISLKQDYYIFEIDWRESEVVWKINGTHVFTASINIFDKMYLSCSSGVRKKLEAIELPVSFDFDWIRYYKKR